MSKEDAKSKTAVERRRAELVAEAKYQAELRRIERANRTRRREHPHATYVERRSESDDEVRANISAEFVPLFERVKRGIKGSPRMTRTEAFLQYIADHPGDVLAAVEDKTDALVRELERQERDAMRALRRSPRRYTQEQRAEVPF